jgi:diguanylate cyclase (GGDEF)-like protein
MFLVIKVLGFILLSIIAEVFGCKVLSQSGGLTYTNVAILVSAIGVADIAWLFIKIVNPIKNLYEALKIVNFDDDQIDLSKIDLLQANGTSEIKKIIKKFKYLVDIIAERINRINSETYKSEHDGLSGCYNRVHLDAVKGKYETSQYVTIIFIDVNNLKRMNDDFGHEAGDNLIMAAANKLKFWDTYGDVYRVGGDEFMVVIVNQTPEYINKVFNQWYPTVGQLNRSTDSFKCLLSYGISFGTKGCSFEAIQKDADDKMYEYKVAIKKKLGEPMR